MLRVLGADAPLQLGEGQLRVLASLARSRGSGVWTDLSSNQLVELRVKAEKVDENIRKSHLPGGLIASVRFADTNQSEVAAYENLDESAAYTGFFLASSAFRYAVYREPAALSNVRAALDGIELLLRVSGKPGYLPRFAGLASDPAYKAYYARWGGADPAHEGRGRLAFPGSGGSGSYIWLGGPDAECYAGVNVGLSSLFQFVREPKIRERVTNIVDLMMTRLVADQWRLDDGQGSVTFCPPLLAAALLRTAATVTPRKYDVLYQARLNEMLASHGGDPQIQPALCAYCDYRDSVSLLANLMVLSRLEPETSPGKLFYQERFAQLYRRSSYQLNPWLAASYVSIFEHAPNDTASKAVLQGLLYQFPIPRWARGGIRTTNDGLETLEANGVTWTKQTLQLEQRSVTAFQWEQSPCWLPPGENTPVVHPGIDFTLPFWIARDANVIPDAESLALPGPKDRLRGPTNTARLRLPATNAPAARPAVTLPPAAKQTN